jgi:acyl-coenzyme A thioesterase PaaI-like protein
MSDTENLLDESEVRSFLSGLAFVREFSINVVSLKPGSVTVELPFDERFSGPPNLFPASMVGTAGDVAAVASCLTLMPKGWALATLDFTIKMTGVAGIARQGAGVAGWPYQLDRRRRRLRCIGRHRALVRNRARHDPQLQHQVNCDRIGVQADRHVVIIFGFG